ncbi:hypothetical protein NDU88_008847 [Pleurodeles waltl]|uniref:Uncharacterized protein n=1 Tax=Pleurodeles waltl TaxID=8319 RepID=A0AAV7RWY2_PLEWA|nr:hypothetical protein NDU88_008847 [Pleurodeles waltl]
MAPRWGAPRSGGLWPEPGVPRLLQTLFHEPRRLLLIIRHPAIPGRNKVRTSGHISYVRSVWMEPQDPTQSKHAFYDTDRPDNFSKQLKPRPLLDGRIRHQHNGSNERRKAFLALAYANWR